MYKLIVADDHEIVRAGIRFIVEENDKFSIVNEASSFNELSHILTSNICDILIMDLNLGDRNGISAIREISDMYPSLCILTISMFPEDPYALQSIQAGASGYISKKIAFQELTTALEVVLSGEVYLSQEYSQTLPFGIDLIKNSKHPLKTLSKREYEVYEMISSGTNYKEIAQILNLSPKTISTYRTRILDKLSLSNTNQLIHYSLHNSLGMSN